MKTVSFNVTRGMIVVPQKLFEEIDELQKAEQIDLPFYF